MGNSYSEIESVTLGLGIASIGDQAFSDWAVLKSVTIPGSVESIGNEAFCNCWNLTGLTIPSGVKSIGDLAFCGCEKLTSLTIPSGVESIGEQAFDSCFGLTSVTIPAGVKSIGNRAFVSCSQVTSFTFSGDVGSIGEDAFADCIALTSVVFPGGVESVGPGAFNNCKELTGVTFSGNVDAVGDYAFSYCTALTSVTFAGDIGDSAFNDCEGLTRIQIPVAVANIGPGMFHGCDNLAAVYIKSVEQIDKQALNGCEELRDVYFGGTQAEWDAAGGAAALANAGDPRPVLHPETAGLPDTEAGDLETLLRLIREGTDSKAGRTEVWLAGDIDLGGDALTIPEDCNLVLDLRGRNITSSNSPAIEVLGDLTVLDSTAGQAPVVTGTAVSYTSGRIIAIGGDGVYVQPGRTFQLLSGTIDAAGRGVAVYADRNEDSEWFETTAQITGGYVKAVDSAVLVRGNGAAANIGEAVLASERAPVITGGEDGAAGDTSIALNGAMLIARGAAPGSLPCGIYHPQKGRLNIYRTEIYAQGGVGVLMRGGTLSINSDPTKFYTGGSGQGVIGSPAQVLPAGQPIVMDQASKLYDCDRITVYLSKLLSNPTEFRPTAYPTDGFGLSTVISSNGGEKYSFGRFCTVTFDPNGGEGGGTRTTNANGEAEWPDDPVREGHVFRGWSTGRSDLAGIIGQPYRFTKDTKLYAQWIPEGAYVVTFLSAANGSVHAVSVTGLDGVLVDWPTSALYGYEGKVFMGWSADPDGTTQYPFDRPFTKDTTLYARWGNPVRPHTITFDYNDGSGNTTTMQTDLNGLLPGRPTPTRNGYVFKGWSWSSSYDIFPRSDFAFYEDTRFYARRIPNDGYIITFHPNNGGADETRRTLATGVVTDWPDEPKLEGYTFDGWYSAASSGTRVTTSTVFQGNATVYAHWTQASSGISPTDTYQIYTPGSAYGGSFSVSHTTAAGTVVTVQASPWGNYALSQISVTRLDTGGTVSLSGSGNRYTFAMPASDVRLGLAYVQTSGGFGNPKRVRFHPRRS